MMQEPVSVLHHFIRMEQRRSRSVKHPVSRISRSTVFVYRTQGCRAKYRPMRDPFQILLNSFEKNFEWDQSKRNSTTLYVLSPIYSQLLSYRMFTTISLVSIKRRLGSYMVSNSFAVVTSCLRRCQGVTTGNQCQHSPPLWRVPQT